MKLINQQSLPSIIIIIIIIVQRPLSIGVDSARSTGQDPTSAEKWSGPLIDGPDQVFGTVKKSDNRHYGVNRDIRPSKPVFTTLNEQPDTTGKLFHFVAKEVLTRFDLRVENLRAQTYYGAAMSGEYNGCQKLIGDDQPMTYFTTTAQPTAQTFLLIHMLPITA